MFKAAKIRLILFKHRGLKKGEWEWVLMNNRQIKNWYKRLLLWGFDLPELDT